MDVRGLDIRLGVASSCALLLLGYFFVAPALYPPSILRIGERLFVGGVSGLAILSSFSVVRHGSRGERRFAICILLLVVLIWAALLWEELSYFYF